MLSEIWSELRFRLRVIVRRDTVERELDEELHFHVEHETEKYVRQGLTRDDSRRRALLAFGGVDRVKDETRDSHGTAPFEHIAQDVRYALRGLRARPLFATVVILTLALGIGVNAAMFGILDRTLFRPPAYLIDPSSVYRVYFDWTGPDGVRGYQRNVEYKRVEDLARWTRSLSGIAGFAYRSLAVDEGDDTKELVVGILSASFFQFFDAKPVVGRFFQSSEDTPPTGEAVAVISYDYWQTKYAARRDVLGARLEIGQRTYKIIGVAPRGFDGMSEGRSPVAFVPLAAYAAAVDPTFYRNYDWSWIELIARRKPGVSADAALADLTNAFRRSWEAERVIEPRLAAAAVVRPEALAGELHLSRAPGEVSETKIMSLLGGVSFIVLLVTCANVANLLLARALRRQREMAVRRAIGGTRARLIQQILTETLVLAAAGAAVGLAVAHVVAGSLQRLLVDSTEPLRVATDGRTLLFASAIVLFSAFCSGVFPALRVGRGDLAGSLKAGTRDGAYRQSRMRTTLLLFQTALSVVLLVGAGLFVRSLQRVRAMRLGYDADKVIYVQANMRDVVLSRAEAIALGSRMEAESRALPGVANASLTVSVPFWTSEAHGLHVPGIDSVRKLGRFTLQAGSPEYFATAGTRILRGRGISALDRASAPYVAVVSAAMAHVLWKDENPLGKCFRIGSDTVPCTTVVGVAENMKMGDITEEDGFTYYLPIAQYYAELDQPPTTAMFVRVRGRPDDFVETVRARMQRLMPGSAYVQVMAMHDIIDPTLRSWSASAAMFLTFGALALVLAVIGLYAVVAFAVVQRHQEFGVRLALGARGADVLRLVVGEAARVTVGGVVIGGAIAFVGGRFVGPLLYHESPHDPLVYGLVASTLLVVGLLASAIPASRAARVDPNVALRAE